MSTIETKKVMVGLEQLVPTILDFLAEGKSITITVTGNSMYPMLKDKRDSVTLSKCDDSGLKRGDIALYRRKNGQYILHRIVRVNDNSFDFCGDNQFVIEKKIDKERIIAVVNSFKREQKEYKCSNILYKVYWNMRIWSILFRQLFYRAYHRIMRLLKKLRRRLFN